jgi:large subunit ribosomal protein L25
MTTLDAQLRDKTVDINKLRNDGKMPAVFYGNKTKSTPISIERKDFIKVWKTVGESGVVTIKSIAGSVDALIHAVDVDPVSDIPRHADFYVFEKGKKIEVDVPLDFVGVSPAIKDLGGSLVKALHDPQHIPHDIKVDISSLIDFNSQILASEIVLPDGVVLVELPHEVVASAAAPKEDEPEEVAPVDLSAIEVEKKGKKEEEGGEAPVAPETKEQA